MAAHRNRDLLVVDDDDEFRSLVARYFRRRVYQVEEVASGSEALVWLSKRHFDVALLDLVLPGMDGLEVLDRLHESDPECQAVMLTGRGSIHSAVEAMKRGACDYLTKPCDLAELEVVIGKAFERGSLHKENQQLRTVIERSEPATIPILGQSPAMQDVKRLIAKAAPTDSSVLILGDSGTGRELVALALHEGSSKSYKPLIVVNCAAMQETLLESDLFGHERGAFTGAVVAKPGLFEVADGGTLFIDEVGEMAGGLQAKLLRVLEDGRYRRVGSTRERRANVRLLAATNKNLPKKSKRDGFATTCTSALTFSQSNYLPYGNGGEMSTCWSITFSPPGTGDRVALNPMLDWRSNSTVGPATYENSSTRSSEPKSSPKTIASRSTTYPWSSLVIRDPRFQARSRQRTIWRHWNANTSSTCSPAKRATKFAPPRHWASAGDACIVYWRSMV